MVKELIQIHDVGSWKFMQSPVSDLLVAGHYEGISFFKRCLDGWKLSHKVDSFNVSSRIMKFANDSTLWMTHGYKGAYRIQFDESLKKTKKIELFGEQDGFSSNILISVYKLDDNLIFTGAEGVYDFNQDVESFTPNTFLTDWFGNAHVSKISFNANGDLFFLADQEFGYLKKESFGKYIKGQYPFKHINKLISDDLENISILDDWNILIGAKDGFIHFDPSQNFEIESNFKVILRSAEIEFPDDSAIIVLGEFLEGIKLEKNQSIKFKYASPYFTGFEYLQYSHRLVGFDNKWSSWSTETNKEYTNLSAGEYSFEIKGKNVYGNESKILTRTFRILPKWYQSTWAYVTYIFLAIFLFGIMSFFQDKKHKKEKKILFRSKEDAIKNKDAEISQVSL